MDDLDGLLGTARERLRGVRKERLGALRMPSAVRRAVGGRPRIVPVGDAWRVGVLLIGDDHVATVGDIERAAQEVRRGYAARSQRERATVRAAAFRGGFAEGEVFHLDWYKVDTAAVASGESSGALAWSNAELQVRWSPAGWLMPLSRYLDEQIELILAPPRAATD